MPLPGSPESVAFTTAQRLTIRNWVGSGAALGVAPPPAPVAAASTNQVAASTQPSATAPAGDVQAGRGLFTSAGCVACHTMEGKGGMAGPDLSHEANLGRSSQWLLAQITDPHKHDPTTTMPAHKNLTPAQLKGLADYILNPAPGSAPVSAQSSAATPPVATNAPAAAPTAPAPQSSCGNRNATASPAKPGTAPPVSTNAPTPAAVASAPTNQVAASAASAASPAKPAAGQTNTTAAAGDSQEGKGLFVSAGCVTCHMIEGKGGKVGPDLSHEAKLGRSSQWLIAQITDPAKHNPATKMPAHKDLTPAQLKSLTDYILNPSSSPVRPVPAQRQLKETTFCLLVNADAGERKRRQRQPGFCAAGRRPTAASATVVKMIGDARHGAVLFDLDCAKCHGKDGEGQVPNPGSQAGVVPALAPIARDFIQHRSRCVRG